MNKSISLRQFARNQDCQIRLPGCDGGGQTTVLAHYRLAGYSGTGMKPPDIMAAWACGSCHDYCDNRKPYEGDRMAVRLAHAEGCLRTIVALEKEGKLK